MYNVRLPPCGVNGDQKAAKCNTRELGGSMVSMKCGFRLEQCFSTLMFLLTDIAAAFVFSAKRKKRKKKPNEVGALKGVSGLPGQPPILNTT